MARTVALGEMRLGRASDEDVRDEERRQAELAALDALAMPDLEGSLPGPLGHEGEHAEALETATPPDPERSSATARTREGDWSDATTEPGARTGAPRQAPSDPELDALDAMAASPRPQRPTRADGSPVPIDEGGVDDSPDSMHAMRGRPELAPDDAELLGDQGLGRMVAPDGRDETADERWSRLRLGGSFRGRPMPHPTGELAEGNIDLESRPVVRNPDGSISTVRSLSFGDERGEVLAPTVSDDGRIMSDDDAIEASRSSGRHLGIFDTPEHATEYAQGLHDDQAERYGRPEFTYDGPDAEPDADADDEALSALAGKPAPTEPTPRLDEGLPSDADIGGARERDGFLGFLRSLQNGLLGAVGRPRREMPHEAADLQARRATGMRERMQAKGVQRREELAAGRQASQDALTAERQAESDARADRGLDLREQQLEISRRSAESSDAARDAQTQHVATLDEIARASREDREDPASAISMGAQNAYRAAIAVLPERLRSSVEASLGGDVSTMSAAQLEGVVRRLQTIGVRGSVGGTGTGTGRAQTRASIAQTLVDRHIAADEEEAERLLDAVGVEGAQATIRADLAPSARRPQGRGGPSRGPTSADRAVAATRTSLAAVRHQIDQLSDGADIPGVGIGDGNTPYRALSAEGRAMRNMIRDLSDNYLRMVSGAAVPEHEIENFAARLAATDEDQFPAALERLERELEARATGQVQDPTSTFRPTGAHGAEPTSSDTVRVRLPSGRVVVGPRSSVSRLPEGSEVLDGP